MDYPSAEMTVFASCGGVAGINKGRIDHATSSVSLTGKTSLSDNIGAQGGYKYEIFNYYLKMGGIVGANNGGGTVLNSLADCAISPEHTASAGRNFTSVVDIGGIAGANSGIITNCRSTQNTSFEFNCSVETRIGGIVGANDSSVYGCYSEAAFTLSNRSETEKIYAGGVAGVNNRGIDSSYAIVSSLSRRLTMSIANVYFGGLFGYADNGIASVNNCFVKLAANGIGNSNVFGFYEGGYIDSWCYVFLTENATGYGDCDKVTKCATEQDLLAAISNRDFEGKGFTLSPDSYPALPHAGNIKQ